MPRVSDAYRDARRDEIATAALRCMARNGVHATSIADIVTESGLSTGAVYSHFTSKAEIARYTVKRYLLVRLDPLEEAAARGEVVAPSTVIRTMIGALGDAGISPGLVLQLWSEAMLEGELADTVRLTASQLRGSIALVLTVWAQQQTQSADDARTLADDAARTVIAVVQGFVANLAVFGPRSRTEYLDSLRLVLETAAD